MSTRRTTSSKAVLHAYVSMKFNYQKCDVYALGLICLCKALQKDVHDLYDMENYVVDSQLLDKYLADYGHKFGVLLRN